MTDLERMPVGFGPREDTQAKSLEPLIPVTFYHSEKARGKTAPRYLVSWKSSPVWVWNLVQDKSREITQHCYLRLGSELYSTLICAIHLGFP